LAHQFCPFNVALLTGLNNNVRPPGEKRQDNSGRDGLNVREDLRHENVGKALVFLGQLLLVHAVELVALQPHVLQGLPCRLSVRESLKNRCNLFGQLCHQYPTTFDRTQGLRGWVSSWYRCVYCCSDGRARGEEQAERTSSATWSSWPFAKSSGLFSSCTSIGMVRQK